jgi:hypothetical protein
MRLGTVPRNRCAIERIAAAQVARTRNAGVFTAGRPRTSAKRSCGAAAAEKTS